MHRDRQRATRSAAMQRCARPISARATCDARGRGIAGELRAQPRPVRYFALGRGGRGGHAARPQRHGQDHHDPLDHGPDPAARRRDHVHRALPSRGRRRRRSPAQASVWCRKAGRFFRCSPWRRISSATAANRLGRAAGVDACRGSISCFPGCRSGPADGPHVVGRRAADAGDRPRADDQSASADPRRGDRGIGAVVARRDLELPLGA